MLVGDGRGGRWCSPRGLSSVGNSGLLIGAWARPRAKTGSRGIGGQTDKADLSPVIGLVPVSRPAIAIETVGFGISVEPDGVGLLDPRCEQPMDDIGLEIKVRLAAGAFHKETLRTWLLVGEPPPEILADLVGKLGDAGSHSGGDVLAATAERFHRPDRRVGDAGEGAAPAGMSSADHAGFGIGEQHGRAIGRA